MIVRDEILHYFQVMTLDEWVIYLAAGGEAPTNLRECEEMIERARQMVNSDELEKSPVPSPGWKAA